MTQRKKTKRKGRGFTLIELLVVIVIISILTVAGIVSFGTIQANSRDQKRQQNATIIAEALEKYYNANGEYPGVASIADKPVVTVKTKLGITDTDVLVFPNAPNTGNSTLTTGAASKDNTKYTATRPSNSTQCLTTDPGGGCDNFTLQWLSEVDGSTKTISSRHP